ncbi:MAG TPA: serine/threonine-protein kinase [Gemmatales bacterium]|nr:serine/threonine-protein kinase [Gemmatales bacterium]
MNEKVINLLEVWKAARELGVALNAEYLCRDCPELRDEVRAKLQELSAANTDSSSVETKPFVKEPDSQGSAIAPTLPPNKSDESSHPSQPFGYNSSQPLIPGYRIERELGRGGMGLVYLATDLALQRPVAIKLGLSQTKLSTQTRFQTEAAALARLHHPHIVQVYAAGTTPSGQTYFVMEYVADGSLSDRIGKSPQPVADSARLLQLLAKAAHAAHQRGIIHRDLKPANVLLDTATDEPALNCAWGCPKIADFGVVKLMDHLSGELAATSTGDVLGTPSYMAPEQARSGKKIGPTVDVYALGAILYTLLAGHPPFQGGTSIDVMLKVLDEAPKPLREFRPEVPPTLAAICQKCLEKDPADRYATAAELATALENYSKGKPGTVTVRRSSTTIKPPVRSGRSGPLPPYASLIRSPALPPEEVIDLADTNKHGVKYKIHCPLGHTLEIGASHLGKRLLCPGCNAVIHTSPPHPGEPPGVKYEVQCAHGHILRVKQKYLGKEIQCPSCQQLIPMTPGTMLNSQGVMLSDDRMS